MTNQTKTILTKEKPLIARRLAIVPTTMCTLNCKHCGNHETVHYETVLYAY